MWSCAVLGLMQVGKDDKMRGGYIAFVPYRMISRRDLRWHSSFDLWLSIEIHTW